MMTNLSFGVLILPLLGFLILGVLGRFMSRGAILAVAWGACGLAFVFAFLSFLSMIGTPVSGRVSDPTIYTWVVSGNLQISFGQLFDPLSATMLMIINGVGRLGAGWSGIIPAHWLLVPAPCGGCGGTESLCDQRHRRLWPDAGDFPDLYQLRLAQLPGCFWQTLPFCTGRPDGNGYYAAAFPGLYRQVGAVAALHVVARCYGRPDARQRADPCRDDGDCRRLPGCPR